MLTVNADRDVVGRQLGGGELACPSCGGVLARWGNGAERRVRLLDGPDVWFCPRRARCRGCGRTHVLLPAWCLARRADAGEVIGLALEAGAAGSGHRVIAARLGRPPSTVRGWLRALARRAERVRRVFTALAASLVTDPPLPAPAGSPLADAIAAVAAAAAAAARVPGVGMVPGGHGGAVAAGRRGDLRAAAGPGLAGPGGQHELALGGAAVSRDPR